MSETNTDPTEVTLSYTNEEGDPVEYTQTIPYDQIHKVIGEMDDVAWLGD